MVNNTGLIDAKSLIKMRIDDCIFLIKECARHGRVSAHSIEAELFVTILKNAELIIEELEMEQQ